MPYKRIVGIYQIQSKIYLDRIYIGCSVNIKTRWKDHRHDLRENIHDNKKLQNHYNKYGEDDLVFSILEQFDFVSKEHLISREQYYFDIFDPYFNISKKAGNESIGHKVPDWLIEKIRKLSTGRKDSPETTERRRKSHLGTYGVNNGRKFSEEVNQKNRERNLGNKNGFFGRHHTRESIEKMLETRKRNKELKSIK